MLILALDTTTRGGSVAVADDDRVLAVVQGDASRTHGERMPGEIARALEVRYVLEGSVARAEQRLRIRVQLVDASNGYSLWSDSFDREVRDVLNIQEEIAAAVAESLLGPLGVQPHAAAVGGTTSTEAYELYLAAKASMNLSARDGTRGLEQIERALRLDPNFALAWAQKSRLLNSAAQYSWVTPQQQADAESAARRALELAPDLGLAHTALAATIMHDRVGAEAEFRKGLSLGSWEEVDLYGGFLNSVGHYGRAREYLFEARARDPLNPRAAAWLAGAYDGLGDSAAALAELERGRRVASQPRGALASEEMIIRLGLGEPDEARAVIERYPEFRESPDTRELLRQLEPLNAALGDPERVMTELRALRDQQVWGAMLFAIAAMSGEPEFAVEGFIEVERERKQPVLGYGILWRPVFRDARRLPRFKDLVREAGFIEYWREYGWPSFCRPVGADDFECV